MPRKSAYDWTLVDWSYSTTDLALGLGCSRGLVSAARAKHAPETLTRHEPHIRACVICGRTFVTSPSDNTVSCPRRKCRRERSSLAKIGKPQSAATRRKISTKAKKQDRSANLTRGTFYASALNAIAPEENYEARVWQIVTPKGRVRRVVNLRNWLYTQLGKKEGERVCKILNQMSGAMRAGKPGWVTRCGWSLLDASEAKPPTA